MTKRSTERGFSLIEMLVAMTIMLAVTAGVFAVMNPSQGQFQAQPEVADMQQRMRVGVDALYKDLLMAGAGSYAGAQAGNLGNFFASILPYRQSANAAIDDGDLKFRDDGVTIFFVPPTTAQTRISSPMPNVSAELKVEPDPGCPKNEQLCGFEEGMVVLIYDSSGAYDTMTITAVQDSAAHLQHRQQGDLSKAYDAGAKVAQVGQHIYYWNKTTNQLMHAGGAPNDPGVPVVDNVVDVEFEYWGEPQPPVLRAPGVDQSTTYGPEPPDLGVALGGYWPAGQNCIITTTGAGAGQQQTPRLPVLNGGNSGLVKLNDPGNPQTLLTDGPWCPDPNNSNRWDADLIRIRKVTAKLRVQAAVDALRGTDTVLWRRPGKPNPAGQLIPDQEIRFDVTPRNLNLGR
jgi:prepilin-type N-terminal cleavage/methylation domain-containing protein